MQYFIVTVPSLVPERNRPGGDAKETKSQLRVEGKQA